MSLRMKRRTLLGMAAGAGASALFLPSLLRGQSVSDAQKRRVLFIYAEGGWTAPAMTMRPPWAPAAWSDYDPWDPADFETPDDMEWEFDLTDSRLEESHFSRVLAPLYRHRDVMTMTEGLAMLSTAADPYGDGHAKGHIACMSAIPPAYEFDGVKSQGSGPSMDQRINEFIRQTDPDHQSLDYRPFADDLYHEFLWRSDGNGGAVRLPIESRPTSAFQRLFQGQTSNGEQANPLDVGRNAALAVAQQQYDRVIPRLSSEDRVKLESHRDMLSELQRRLGRTVDCGAPERPADNQGLPRAERTVADMEAFGLLIATAFGCGASRVASLGMVGVPPEGYGLPAEAAIHHEYEHLCSPFDRSASEEFTRAQEGMIKRNIWQAEQVAKVIDSLRSVPEDGGTLLDNTLVVYVSEISHGAHGHEHYPVILFGGLAGAVTPGRYIKYPQNNPIPFDRNYYNRWTGVPHSQLFVSICQAFGMELDHLGDVAQLRGRFPEKGVDRMISLSGPLPRLKA